MGSVPSTFPFQKVVVTGGAGFLGHFVVQKLRSYPDVQVIVPRSKDYDLVHEANVKRLLADTDPDLVIQTIASIFNVRESGGLPIDALLKQYLAEKHLLLVLDHFEQVVSAAPKIGELLSAAPKLKIIASSRATRCSGGPK